LHPQLDYPGLGTGLAMARALIEQRRKSQPSEHAFNQAPVTSLEINARKLAAIQPIHISRKTTGTARD
jgi:hypothetical protein